MEIPKLIILLCCTYHSFASEHSHLIPIEDYETELQVLGQHVEIPETPVKVIKITKTIAVKVPVPYPVSVKEKVPYPVHVSKPYPVPVPQIIHVPHIVPQKPQHPHDASHESGPAPYQNGPSYQVQETPSHESFGTGDHSFHGPSYTANSGHVNSDDDHSSVGSFGGAHDSPNSYYGYSGDEGDGSLESKSYDKAINDYLQKHHSGGNSGYNH